MAPKKKKSQKPLPVGMVKDLARVKKDITRVKRNATSDELAPSYIDVDVGTPFSSPTFDKKKRGIDFSKFRDIYGVMNGPAPIAVSKPVKDQAMWSEFPYDEPKLTESFRALGGATSWVRFNDLDSSLGNLSMTQLFSAWPRTDEELESADIAAIAGDLSNYDFSGIDKHVGAVAAVGKNVDFRIGDGHATCDLLCKGEAVRVVVRLLLWF